MTVNLRALREREPGSVALRRYDGITVMLTDKPSGADAGVEWVQKLVADLSVPKFGAYGIREEHIPDLVAKAAQSSSMKANPIVLTADELAQTLRVAL